MLTVLKALRRYFQEYIEPRVQYKQNKEFKLKVLHPLTLDTPDENEVYPIGPPEPILDVHQAPGSIQTIRKHEASSSLRSTPT